MLIRSIFLSVLISTFSSFLTKNQLTSECVRESWSDLEIRNDNIVALVLARGGSKGVLLKNLAKIDGVTLLGRALRVIKNTHAFAEMWVSTDNMLIAREADIFGANVHLRSEHSARDEATSIEAVQEFLKHHSNVHNVALIQCTSVFLRERYLAEAVHLFRGNDCVFSVVRSWQLRWQQVVNQLLPINFDRENRPRRQDWRGELIETGMFYFSRRKLIEQMGVFQNERCQFVEIDAKDTMEIDNPIQLKLTNILIKLPEWN